MHDTARFLGYPSDSSRAARERAREATCGRHLRWTGQGQPGWAPPPLVIAASPLLPLPLWLNSSPVGATLRPSPQWLSSSPLTHLAGVGQCSLAIGHGCLVGLLAGVLDRRPVSPLPSTTARSGAGSGWHGRGKIVDSTVYPEARWRRPLPVCVQLGRHRDRVADRQGRAASPVSGIPD